MSKKNFVIGVVLVLIFVCIGINLLEKKMISKNDVASGTEKAVMDVVVSVEAGDMIVAGDGEQSFFLGIVRFKRYAGLYWEIYIRSPMLRYNGRSSITSISLVNFLGTDGFICRVPEENVEAAIKGMFGLSVNYQK